MKKILCLLLTAVLFAGCANVNQIPQITKGYQADQQVTNLEETGTAEEILAARRKIVVDEMRAMMTVLWTPDRTVTYNIDGLPAGSTEIVLRKDVVYQGIPYTNGHCSGYSFLFYATGEDNGVYTLSGLTSDSLSGAGIARVGNSCSSAIAWSWGRIGNSFSFSGTKWMTETNGCLKVGDYVFDGVNYGDTTSVAICQENGPKKMYECYAQLLPGDAMVQRTLTHGHSVMISDVNVVYKADGSVDGDASTVTILDQSYTGEIKQPTVNVEGVGPVVVLQEVDWVRSFAQIYTAGYLPITIRELQDPSALPPVEITDYTDAPTVENMFSGNVESNYRIAYITVTVYDKKDRAVQEATCFSKNSEEYKFDLSRFPQDAAQGKVQGTLDLDTLPKGEYRCSFTCRVSTGEMITFRDFTFEK